MSWRTDTADGGIERRLFLKTIGIGAATVAGVGTAAAHGGEHEGGRIHDQRHLAAARRGTAAYHNVERAEADGYLDTGECISSPAGGMGVHYVNPQLMDGELNVAQPEALLYEPTDNGEKLVGVEYILPGPEQEASPTFLDQEMHYDSHAGGYTLHAWIWKHNPDGMFAAFNPNVEC